MQLVATSQQTITTLANPSILFLAPELASFKRSLDAAVMTRDAAVAQSTCESCTAGIVMKFETWFLMDWAPLFTRALDRNTEACSVFNTLLQQAS